MNKKLRGLLLQVEVMEGSEIKVLNENTFEVDGAEYLVLNEDGYSCLAVYDGEELELGNNLYAYRMN